MASNSKKRRRVLGASCILAALIIASSSFAWFTSKDEVTNRLSATADYSVSIAEDFTPPENWIPGQPINKDVGAVNTGNVDAFVRMWLGGEMRVLKTTASPTADANGQFSSTDATFTNAISNAKLNTARTAGQAASVANDVEDPDLVNMGLTKVYTDSASGLSYYYKMLSTTSTKNPADNQQSNKQDDYSSENDTDYYSEVQAMQAGGVLAYAPDNAEYTYILNQDTELPVYSKKGASGSEVYSVKKRTVPAGTRVYVKNISSDVVGWAVDEDENMSTVHTVFVKAQDWDPTGTINETNHFDPVNVDADSFQPLTPGLYLFARNYDLDADATKANNYEFSGYYYSDVDTVITSADGGVKMTHTQKNTAVANTVTTATDYKASDYSTTKKFKPADGDYGKGTYYALKAENDLATGDNRSDYTVPNGKTKEATNPAPVSAVTVTELDNDMYYITPNNNLELYTANYTTIDSTKLKWFYTADEAVNGSVSNAVLHAWYDADATSNSVPAEDAEFDKNADILIDIALKNVGTGAAEWSVFSTGGKNDSANRTTLTGNAIVPAVNTNLNKNWTFYYNDDVESGDTTERLVDTVTLNQNVTNKAYLAFDFDLNVNLESVQITVDEAGQEMVTPVTTWAATTGTLSTGAYAADYQNYLGNATDADYDGNEIAKIQWDATDVSTYTDKAN